ncbi:hypothetical protein B0H19DRAFT_1066674 [Mycena capillaripes]|nr:hypothetical protein B0H19DRAFT_1066674 [Mycena capillaripes]
MMLLQALLRHIEPLDGVVPAPSSSNLPAVANLSASLSSLRELQRQTTIVVVELPLRIIFLGGGDRDVEDTVVESDLDQRDTTSSGLNTDGEVEEEEILCLFRGRCSVEDVRRELDGTGLEEAVDLDRGLGFAGEGSTGEGEKEKNNAPLGLSPAQSHSRDGKGLTSQVNYDRPPREYLLHHHVEESGSKIENESGSRLVDSEEGRSIDVAPASLMAGRCEPLK